MNHYLIFFIGVFIGFFFGVLAIGMLSAGANADRRLAEIKRWEEIKRGMKNASE
jgi:hypothetical protein